MIETRDRDKLQVGTQLRSSKTYVCTHTHQQHERVESPFSYIQGVVCFTPTLEYRNKGTDMRAPEFSYSEYMLYGIRLTEIIVP